MRVLVVVAHVLLSVHVALVLLRVDEHGVRYFVYPLHASGSHLRIPSTAAALFLAYLRLVTRQYAAVPPLLEAAFPPRRRLHHSPGWPACC